MIKPRIAEGSRIDLDGTVIDKYDGETSVGCGWLYIEDHEAECSADHLDVIRALVESGQLPLWSAAVKLKEARELCCSCDTSDINTPEILIALLELCRVVDEMKEPTS